MKQYLLNPGNRYKYLLVACDTVIVAAVILISYTIRVHLNTSHFDFDRVIKRLDFWHLMIIPLHLFTLYVFDMYNLNRLVSPVRSSIILVISVFSAGGLLSGVLFFIPRYVFGRQVLIIHLIVLSLVLVLWRLSLLKLLKFSGKKKLALICSHPVATKFMEKLSQIQFSGVEVSLVCAPDSNNESYYDAGVEKYSSLSELLHHSNFDILGYDSSGSNFSNEEIRLILETRQKGKGVYDLSSLYINLTGKIPLDFIDGRWMMNRQGLQGMISKPYIQLKRFLDIMLSLILIIFLSPIFLLTALIVKLESQGKMIFSQERLGRNRKPFLCYKFRTMVEDAEQKSGPVWAEGDDPRITKVGRVLRKTRLDELPQLWNILKGDISFVGPRPIRKHFADILSKKIPFYELRFSVQPGLSGWAQVKHDYAGSEDGQLEKFEYELFYIQNMSLFLDIITIIKTVQSFLNLEGR